MKKLLILPLIFLMSGCVSYYYPQTAVRDGVYYAEDDPSYVVPSDAYAGTAYYPWSSLDYFYLGFDARPAYGFGYSGYYDGFGLGLGYGYSPWYGPYRPYGYYSPWFASYYPFYTGGWGHHRHYRGHHRHHRGHHRGYYAGQCWRRGDCQPRHGGDHRRGQNDDAGRGRDDRRHRDGEFAGRADRQAGRNSGSRWQRGERPARRDRENRWDHDGQTAPRGGGSRPGRHEQPAGRDDGSGAGRNQAAPVRRYVSTPPSGHPGSRGMVIRSREAAKPGNSRLEPGATPARSVGERRFGAQAARAGERARPAADGRPVPYRQQGKASRTRMGPVEPVSPAKAVVARAYPAPRPEARSDRAAGGRQHKAAPPPRAAAEPPRDDAGQRQARGERPSSWKEDRDRR